MIESFSCKHTEKVWKAIPTRKWSIDVANKALRKLFMIHSALDIKDLMIPPANRLHKLKGDLREYYSISINDQWRIIFKWNNGKASNVQIVDYH